MHIIVTYDISNDRRLTKVAKITEDYGTRVQKSIFEVEARGKTFSEMKRRIDKVIDPDEDGVKFFLLCARCAERMAEVIGAGVYVDPDAEYEIF